jgi:predicted lipase
MKMLIEREIAITIKKLYEVEDWETTGTDTQFKIVEQEDEVLIVFCPSNSKADWKINFSFPKLPYREMKTKFYVHGGFLKEWKKINNFFLDTIAEIKKPITIVGWSYGGAMATLCMEDVWFHFPEKRSQMRAITFGSPRVVWIRNFKSIEQRWDGTTRYVNGSDIIPTLPFGFLGFKHVVPETHIGDKKSFLRFFFINLYHHINGYIHSLTEN